MIAPLQDHRVERIVRNRILGLEPLERPARVSVVVEVDAAVMRWSRALFTRAIVARCSTALDARGRARETNDTFGFSSRRRPISTRVAVVV